MQLAAKTSIFSLFAGGSAAQKAYKNHGPKDRAELQEYIGEPLARNTVDAFSDGRKY